MNIQITPDLQQLINTDLAWHYHAIPVANRDNCIKFLVSEKEDVEIVEEELEALLNVTIEVEQIDHKSILKLLGKYYRKAQVKGELKLNTHTDFLDKIIEEARNLGSSDIHLEIYEDKARVRIRIDGHLIERYKIDKVDYPELVNKVKIKSNLDISERRLPQDGRIQFDDYDLRVSVLPTLHGEKVVMRILGHDASSLSIEKLGMQSGEQYDYLEGVKKPNGIVLISGPTGSGKTTTLYATLKLLNEEKRNIVTVEDPIEYTLEGINQVQLKEDIGLDFTSALRSFLRQDPDVIMLGEIRDGETAQMAIRASLTGHLVLSTIHTNSAWGTISRLIDMGVPPFLLANTINVSVAQRLVRKLCKTCKEEVEVNKEDYPKILDEKSIPALQFNPVGCEECHYTGYKGRVAIYEIIPIDKELALRIKENKLNIDDYICDHQIESLATRAMSLLKQGITSLEEVYSILT